MKKRVLLIIPAFNEEESIIDTVKQVENFYDENFELNYVVINDGSTDSTGKLLTNSGKNVIHLVSNLGIGGAVQTGYKYAKLHSYDIAVQFDGDGQHDINSLPALISPILQEKNNFTIGSRFVPGEKSNFQSTGLRRLGINIISILIKIVSGQRLYDTTSGYRAADKNVIEYFSDSYPVKYPEPESLVLLLKNGFKFREIPVNMFERTGGESSITPVKSIKYMLEVCSAILLLSFKKGKEEL
ncbi:glycosyl transferase family 2 [Enterococcus saigonensis]|uniref:Glycosyl transferase family 2 n=1 Tax=Enterococcus saigonensis TaxID=1805431 RepID=A0A679IAS9_9ENTE|nr:glycosyltransferase family 2 protein [Enterococcus saigonensis]BCA85450.1 glycosyl transferase family 2 [Enterococcus saigonensis]